MNWRRGLLRLWLVGTAVWLIGWAIFIRLTCHTLPDGKLMCQAAPGGWVAGWGEFAAWSYVELLLLGLSVPAGIFVMGFVAARLVRSFKSERWS